MSSNNTLLGVGEAAPSDGSNDLLNAALDYAAQGWPVFPCQPRGKAPLTTHGFKDASTEPEQIHTWWHAWPDANVGIAVPAGYIVVDIDGPNGWTALGAEGYTLSASVRAQTGRGPGHEHHWYRLPAGVRLRNGRTKLPSVEIKTEGGYVLVPPSVHPSGKAYGWLTPLAEDDIADASEWMLALTERADATVRARPPSEWANVIRGPIPEGHRRDMLLRLGGLLFRCLPAEVAYELGCLWARVSCTPPIEAGEVDRILNDVAGLEKRRRIGAA
jgi:hypothetical protein